MCVGWEGWAIWRCFCSYAIPVVLMKRAVLRVDPWEWQIQCGKSYQASRYRLAEDWMRVHADCSLDGYADAQMCSRASSPPLGAAPSRS